MTVQKKITVTSATLALLLAVPLCVGDKIKDAKKPVDAAKSQNPAPSPQLTPEMESALRAMLDLPPGAKLDLVIEQEGGAEETSKERGRGVGAGADAVGDKLDEKFTGSAPEVAIGRASSRGGSIEREIDASSAQPKSKAWANPLFWVGLLALAGAGAAVYFNLRRAAVVAGVAGIGFLAAAFYPFLTLLAAAGAAAVLLIPYVKAEIDRRKSHEALRAVVAGVDDPSVNVEARNAVKAAVSRESSLEDRQTIEAVKMADQVGKYGVG